MKVVIVEDEVRIREGIIKLLNKFYANVSEIHEAKSGQEGLEVIRRTAPDLVITDIRMEPLNGLKMLDILINIENRAFKAIVLSAYSDFNYARQAISLGVSEYLVKPIDIGEFRKAMQHIENEINKEKQSRMNNPGKLRSLETILSGLMSGQLMLDEELKHFIKNTYNLPTDDKISLVCVYLGRRYDEESLIVASMAAFLLVNGGYPNHHMLFLPFEHELVIILPEYSQQLERFFQNSVVKELNAVAAISAVYGFTVCDRLEQIGTSLANIREYLPWNISLGSDVMISYPKVTMVQTTTPTYPIQIEKDGVAALCAMDYNRLNTHTENMIACLTRKIYSPDVIKKSIIRYLLAILYVVREINFPAYEKLDERHILEAINGAVTIKEIESVVFGLLESVMWRGEKSVGLVVQKARRMAEEFYHQGITLEEISAMLNMTPEYISAQFIKELGMNFSTWIKRVRLQKAKELLLGSNLKIYEISAKVGYSDAKYFSRVFKETEGILPAEYRKSHK